MQWLTGNGGGYTVHGDAVNLAARLKALCKGAWQVAASFRHHRKGAAEAQLVAVGGERWGYRWGYQLPRARPVSSNAVRLRPGVDSRRLHQTLYA